MKLGRVVGTVVSARKDASLTSLKRLVPENLAVALDRKGGSVVAVDAVIMAIVDSFDIEGRSTRLA